MSIRREVVALKHTSTGRIIFLVLLAVALIAGLVWYSEENDDSWISRSEAIHIAVRDAGTKEGLVYDVSVHLRREGQNPVYEIAFRNFSAIYTYEVNALSGEVLNRNKTDT